MILIHIYLPLIAEDNRTNLFFENLHKEAQFTPAQVEFFRSGRNGVTDIGDDWKITRIPLHHETMLTIVYETSLAAKVTDALRAALKATWPERDDIQAFEMNSAGSGKRRSLWSIRGGKD